MKRFLKITINLFTFSILILLIILSTTMIISLNEAGSALSLWRVGYTPIKIYDNKDNLIFTSKENYKYTPMDEISSNISNAFIAIEDQSFYSHRGFNVKRIASSIYDNIINGTSSGASTITQQYIKNAYLSNEKTLKRKLTELAYSIKLEREFTKNQIMEAYLNTILFGKNIYGINMACNIFFNKDPSNISINEAAFLAAIINAPNFYLNNLEEANKRKNLVLSQMNQCNMITDSVESENKMKDIRLTLNNQNTSNAYNSYIDYVLANSSSLATDVYTYLDIEYQNELNKIINNDYGLFNDDTLNCAIIVLDNYSYSIKAIAGSRATNRMVINYATDVYLQPGSTIKPLIDYAPAIEYLDYTLASIIKDEPYTYKDGTPIKNYDNNYLGSITLRKALSDSRNIPAVKLFNEVGYEKAFSFASKLGINNEEIYESDAIGGAKKGYTLLSIANAYQAFANLGYYKQAKSIKKEVINNVVTEYKEKAKLVMKPTTAYLINSVLHDVFKNSSYNLKDSYLMAKTGQTNYDEQTMNKYKIPYGATKDSLLIAYTKDLTIGIWVGYNTISEGKYLDKYKKSIPRNIMKILLDRFATKNLFYEELNQIIKKKIEVINDEAYLSDTGYEEIFITGTEPLIYYNDTLKS